MSVSGAGSAVPDNPAGGERRRDQGSGMIEPVGVIGPGVGLEQKDDDVGGDQEPGDVGRRRPLERVVVV